jgi:hypothetical protein
MNIYSCGTTVEIDALFQDASGNMGDPTNITAQMILPDGTYIDVTTAVQRRDVGSYFIQYIPLISGLHQYRVAGTGVFAAANEGAFYAESSFGGGLLMPGTASLALTTTAPVRTP